MNTRPRAWLRLRSTPVYRRDAFTKGLERLGYEVIVESKVIQPGDILVTWNRHRQNQDIAKRFEAQRQPVIVVENAYISPPWGKKWFAMALNHHLGAGAWYVGDGERWEAFNIELKPWRESGEHVLVLAQRGIGEPGVAMGGFWPRDTERKLKKMTKREIVMRRHPGMAPNPTSLEGALAGAHCAVTWASGAGIKALAAGVPVFYDFPMWIGGEAGKFLDKDLENPRMDDEAREAMFRRLAWCQWNVDEVESGEALRWLLQ